jgi:8-amino-7-oxononanoate synthase
LTNFGTTFMEDHFQKQLQERETDGLLRRLKPELIGIDFSSNDYLGIAKRNAFDIQKKWSKGAGGSRLLTGNSNFAEILEARIASFHGFPSALLFNSGYVANLGLFSAVANRNDIILLDEYAHASMIDGARLSNAKLWRFKHNDMKSLEEKLKRANGHVYLGVESVYSMTGEEVPLEQLVELTAQYGAALIVDEAHAVGVYGKKGEGRMAALNLQRKANAVVVPFGKAMGCHGAVVLGSPALRQYLLNFSRPLIYTTALPEQALQIIEQAYSQVELAVAQREIIQHLIEHFHRCIERLSFGRWSETKGAIQSMIIPDSDTIKRISEQLQQSGFNVYPILYPTVKKEEECIRFSLHAFNTTQEVDALFRALEKTSGL